MEEKEQKKQFFENMLIFVKNTFPSGFKKYHNSIETSRPYFEGISVGSHLSIQEKPDLVVRGLWPSSPKNNKTSSFDIPIGRYHTHKPEQMQERIDYVKNQLIGHCL